MATNTPNYNLQLVPANTRQWQDAMNNNLSAIDALIAKYVGSLSLTGVWQNSTAYTVGQIAVDNILGQLFQCAVAHTSAASPTTFLADRTANSTYWTNVTLAVVNAASSAAAALVSANNSASSANSASQAALNTASDAVDTAADVVTTAAAAANSASSAVSSANSASNSASSAAAAAASAASLSFPTITGHGLEHVRVAAGATTFEYSNTFYGILDYAATRVSVTGSTHPLPAATGGAVALTTLNSSAVTYLLPSATKRGATTAGPVFFGYVETVQGATAGTMAFSATANGETISYNGATSLPSAATVVGSITGYSYMIAQGETVWRLAQPYKSNS